MCVMKIKILEVISPQNLKSRLNCFISIYIYAELFIQIDIKIYNYHVPMVGVCGGGGGSEKPIFLWGRGFSWDQDKTGV